MKCERCRKRYRGHGDWNVTAVAGRIAGYLCPRCQTPEENAEAVINEATLHYVQDGLSGRIHGFPKETA